MNEFKPINEEILEELEILSAMKKRCLIKFEAENGGTSVLNTRIMGICSLGDVKYLKTEEGLSIRLDKLIQVDDNLLKKNC
jgi:hypothetical protein